MSLDMVNEPEPNDRPNTNQGQAADEALTPEIRELLADLALNSESHTELSDLLAERSRMLDALVERHPEYVGPATDLRTKVAQLERLLAGLGQEVMRYSHAYEDAAVGIVSAQT